MTTDKHKDLDQNIPTTDVRVARLENIVEQLETLVNKLECRIFNLENPLEQIFIDSMNKCPACNIEFKGTMGYVCNRTDCPYSTSVTSENFEPLNRGG